MMPRRFGRRAAAAPKAPRERQLEDLISVGPATVRDFALLGIHSVAELVTCEASELYERLCILSGARHDPCCEDVFAAAIAQARDPALPEEMKQWWYWTQVRKGSDAAEPAPRRRKRRRS